VTPHTAEVAKKVASFKEKIGLTPSVAAPGETHPGDATAVGLDCFNNIISY